MRVYPLLVLVLAGCAATGDGAGEGSYTEPYGLIESGSPSSVRKEARAHINSIDGRTPFDPRRGEIVKPGKRVVELRFSSGEGAGVNEKHSKILELDVAPCTRYRIVAHYTSTTHANWEPVVYPEPIGECLARFPAAKKP
jgi:hypothetical protein